MEPQISPHLEIMETFLKIWTTLKNKGMVSVWGGLRLYAAVEDSFAKDP